MSKSLGQVAKTAVRNRGNLTDALTDTDWQAAAEAVQVRLVEARDAVIEAAKAWVQTAGNGEPINLDEVVLYAAVAALQEMESG